MNSLVINALKNLNVPVRFQTYSGTETTYITFFNYLENGTSYADNKETSTGYYIQVDVWSLGDYTALVKSVLEALEIAEFRRTYATDLYEKDTKIFHKIIRITKFREVL